MFIIKSLSLFIVSLFLLSCSTSEKLSNLEKISNLVSFKKDAINIHYTAVDELNFFDSNTHALIFTVYQLDTINNFNLLVKEPRELEKLMAGIRFDNTVLSFDKFTVVPKSEHLIKLDRVKGAKWVVLLAGYYEYSKIEDVYIAYQSTVKEKGWLDFSDTIEYNVLDINILFDKNRLIKETQQP